MLCCGYNADNAINILGYDTLAETDFCTLQCDLGGAPLPQPWLWPSVTSLLPKGLPGLPGSVLERLSKSQNDLLYSSCLLLAQLHLFVPPTADIHLKKDGANRGGVEQPCHIYPPDSQLLKANISGYSLPPLGRGYWGDNPVCGEVQLG